MFNFGGGMPTAAYSLDFQFDYEGFFARLFATIRICAACGVPAPEVVGEFGRYTVASHSLYLFEVGAVKDGRTTDEPWYLIDGSLMVSAPDTLIVDDQQFIILPLNGWDDPVQSVVIGGRRTCNSDDMYPQPGGEPLMLPRTTGGLVVGVFGVGAYQAMLGGRGGAHHCLNPEMRRLIIEDGPQGLTVREIAPQSLSQIMVALGYGQTTPSRRRAPVAARRRVEAVRPLAARPACLPAPTKDTPVWANG